MSDRDTTKDLMVRLERHYLNPNDKLPAGVFLPEVGWNGYGGNTTRCDALFVGFTSASGRLLVGHEVKASRSDWLAELRKTGKADSWADQCHQWWLVTIPGVVHDGELPNGWGLMVPGPKNRMKVVSPAVTHADLAPSWDASRSIVARLNTLHRDTITDALKQSREQQEAEFNDRVDRAAASRMANVRGSEQLQTLVDRYEEALGGTLVGPGERSYGSRYNEEDLRDAAAWLTARREFLEGQRSIERPYGLAQLRSALEQTEAALRTLTELEAQCAEITHPIGDAA